MYKEVTIKGRDLKEDDALQGFFQSIELGCNSVLTSPFFIPLFREVVKKDIDIAAEVNTLESSVRSHSALSAIRRGANAINLVIPTVWTANRKLELVADDIESQRKVCEEHGSTLRVMLDYRDMDSKTIYEVTAIACDLGVEYFYPSNGNFLDDFSDNLLWALELQEKYGVSCITNGKIWKSNQYDTVRTSNIYGINFQSPMAVYNSMNRNSKDRTH